MRPATIVFLVNGGPASAMGTRARSFEERLKDEFLICIAYRSSNKIYAIFQFFLQLVRARPAVCYVLDMSFSGVLAAGFYRAVSSCRVVVDSGDAIYELTLSSGSRRGVRLWLTKLLERYAAWISDRMVVRSHPHQELLGRQGVAADAIPDGVDIRQFARKPEHDLRRQLNLEGYTVIGLLGSLIWNPRYQLGYGWELVELIDLLRDRSVKGLVIGDGSGLPELQARCAARGLEDRIVFVGRIPYDDLPQYLNLMDICLSTQTNDAAGQVRTTGKLPLYLASGGYVLASEVGEAARVLPPQMLVPYHGTVDFEYPSRLADRVRSLLEHPECLQQRAQSVGIAQTHFDYDILAARVRQTIHKLLPPSYGDRGRKFPVPTSVTAAANGKTDVTHSSRN